MSSRTQSRETVVGHVDELPPGTRKIVDVDGTSVGVFNVNGTLVAYRNRCPHERAPVCLGGVDGTTLVSAPGEHVWGRAGEILMCPWHGWEFDLLTGQCLTDRRRLHRYDVVVEDTEIRVLH